MIWMYFLFLCFCQYVTIPMMVFVHKSLTTYLSVAGIPYPLLHLIDLLD